MPLVTNKSRPNNRHITHPIGRVAPLGKWGLAGGLLVVGALLACKGHGLRKQESTAGPNGAAAVPAPPGSATAVASAKPKVEGGAVGSAWSSDSQRWVQAFRYDLPDASPVGGSWAEARQACLGGNFDLCTEDQWNMVCAQAPSVGKLASWTLSPIASGTGWVVRGGNGCGARTTTTDEASTPGRVGLCCEPRASISPIGTRQEAVMKAAQTYIGLIEAAANSGSASRIVALLADPAKLYGTERTHEEARKALEWDLPRWSDARTRLIECEADVPRPNGTLECDTVAVRTKSSDGTRQLSVFRQRFEYVQFKYVVFGQPRQIKRKWGPY
jgi:hypothetical protein